MMEKSIVKGIDVRTMGAVIASRIGMKRQLPAEPVVPRASKPAASRNDPCPCGSGKKYKRCCMSQYRGVR
jgi:preprotein translocase subunit SecA